jgi:farnesyl diphosphate synthase
MGLEPARKKAEELVAQAHQALHTLPYDTTELAALASYVIARKF